MNIKKYLLSIIVIVLLAIPTFSRMVRPGMYTTQDFHFFRLVEFDRCVIDLQIPCRWSSHAGLGYGEPLFNFYGQLGYILPEFVHLFQVSFIDSLKFAFAFSLVASGLSMFVAAKYFWKSNSSALVSSIIYIYAPYRAVDVWVRGALPEAISFIIIPLLFVLYDKLITKPSRDNILLFSIALSILVATHNLSVVLLVPVLSLWLLHRVYQLRRIKNIFPVIISVFITLLISAFYVLPVIAESHLVRLDTTKDGYFNFRGHFTSLYQLLFSRYWGYGGSVFGLEDGLNLSVGYIQWMFPSLGLISAILISLWGRKKITAEILNIFILVLIGWVCLFLTHERATSLWLLVESMQYIQFPWRFLAPAVFAFSLAGGGVVSLIRSKYQPVLSIILIVLAILSTITFFREDIWLDVSDNDLINGQKWEDQTRASIGDYWPVYSVIIPEMPASVENDWVVLKNKKSNEVTFFLKPSRPDSRIELPVNYFPYWKAFVDGHTSDVLITDSGKVGIQNTEGNEIKIIFENSLPRNLGNLTTIFSFLLIVLYIISRRYEYKK